MELIWVIAICAALFFMFAFPRQTAGFICFLVVGGLGIWAYSAYQDKIQAKERAAILVSAYVLAEKCPDPNFPLVINLINTTAKRVDSVHIRVNAKRNGYSSEVYSDSMTSDRILDPGQQYLSCWKLEPYSFRSDFTQETADRAQWAAEVVSVEFAE